MVALWGSPVILIVAPFTLSVERRGVPFFPVTVEP
jgi:hypothetical protein